MCLCVHKTDRAAQQSFALLKVPLWFWTLGSRLINAEWNASEFMNEGLSYHRSPWGAKLGNRVGEIGQRGQEGVSQSSGGLWQSCQRSLTFLIVVIFGSSRSSLLIILSDRILQSDQAAMGFGVTNLPGSHEKMLSTQETLALRGKWIEKQILIHLPKIN